MKQIQEIWALRMRKLERMWIVIFSIKFHFFQISVYNFFYLKTFLICKQYFWVFHFLSPFFDPQLHLRAQVKCIVLYPYLWCALKSMVETDGTALISANQMIPFETILFQRYNYCCFCSKLRADFPKFKVQPVLCRYSRNSFVEFQLAI